jgi:hypothetical protein
VDALLADGFTLTTVARAPGGRAGEPSHVVVLTRSPSTIMPRAMRSFGACELTLQRWRCDQKAWHRNWAAAHGVTVAASHTAADGDVAARLLNLLPNGFPHWAYRNSGLLLGASVLHVVDCDLGAFWASGGTHGSGDLEDEEPVTITIDLGQPRMVDEVCVPTLRKERPPRCDMLLHARYALSAAAAHEPPRLQRAEMDVTMRRL